MPNKFQYVGKNFKDECHNQALRMKDL
jgi:hypothetical protein